MCMRTAHIRNLASKRIYNPQTGEVRELHCNSWLCPECSKRKKAILLNGIKLYFCHSRYVRLWTFTASSANISISEHTQLMRAAFHVFLKNIRRSKALNEETRRFKYVRVVEFHKSGYIHFHLLIDKFIPQSLVASIWQAALLTVHPAYTDSTNGYVFVRAQMSAKIAAGYVVKYVVKSVEDGVCTIARWTKAKGTPIFARYRSDVKWLVLEFTSTGRLFSSSLELLQLECPNLSVQQTLLQLNMESNT